MSKKPAASTENVFFEYRVASRRVTKVLKSGRIFSFASLSVIGNGAGSYGIGTGKAMEAMHAHKKSIVSAKKNLKTVKIGRTIPHAVSARFGSTKVILRPALPGTGIVAGGAVKILLEGIGVKDIVAKIIGSTNKYTALLCTTRALDKLRSVRQIAILRRKKVKDVVSAMPSKSQNTNDTTSEQENS